MIWAKVKPNHVRSSNVFCVKKYGASNFKYTQLPICQLLRKKNLYFCKMVKIEIYTDGSYDNDTNKGAWAAIIFIDDKKNILSGKASNSTHNRMEITAVIEAISFVKIHCKNTCCNIIIFSDSQYVVGLPERQTKIQSQDFVTKKGKTLNNTDLIKTFFEALAFQPTSLVKVKAHQKKTDVENHNIEVDRLCRKLVREG